MKKHFLYAGKEMFFDILKNSNWSYHLSKPDSFLFIRATNQKQLLLLSVFYPLFDTNDCKPNTCVLTFQPHLPFTRQGAAEKYHFEKIRNSRFQ